MRARTKNKISWELENNRKIGTGKEQKNGSRKQQEVMLTQNHENGKLMGTGNHGNMKCGTGISNGKEINGNGKCGTGISSNGDGKLGNWEQEIMGTGNQGNNGNGKSWEQETTMSS